MDLDEVRSLLDPTVTYGLGAVTELPALVASLRARRTLLVCGRRSFEASGAAVVLPDLEQLGAVARWDDFRPNTDADDLAGGLEVLRSFKPDLILGVGGGSAMDMAKLLAAYATTPGDVRDVIAAGARIDGRDPQLVLVPTTSGSGAEATHFAVVYLGSEKHSIAGPALHADAVVLDPELSLSGSTHQRATSGIDAVAQAIESLWATGADDDSRGYARQALTLLLPALVPYVTSDVPDAQLAHDVTHGAHLAGRAIDISKTTAAHALSYGLTKGYGVPHGHAVGLTLGAFIAAHADAGTDELQERIEPPTHRAVMDEILVLLGASDGDAAHRRVDGLLTELGLEPGLAANGVTTAAQRRALAEGVNVERLDNNPVVYDTAGLEALLERCG